MVPDLAKPAETTWRVELSPKGRLTLAASEEGARLEPGLVEGLGAAFARGSGWGLLHLGLTAPTQVLPGELAFWRDLATRYVAARCLQGGGADPAAPLGAVALETSDARDLALRAPPMRGGEYVTEERLLLLWAELDEAFRADVFEVGRGLAAYLRLRSEAWHVVGRVHLHLAENKKDALFPFAFMATYTTRLAAHGAAQHVPLGRALEDYAGEARRDALLALLEPVRRAAQECPWLGALVESGALFHPLRWTAVEAARMLADVARLEAAGVVVRMPAGWARGKPPRPQVTAQVGDAVPSTLGAASLLDFGVEVTLDGERLTKAEVRSLLAETTGLALLRGRWVEVDAQKIGAQLERMTSRTTPGARGATRACAVGT